MININKHDTVNSNKINRHCLTNKEINKMTKTTKTKIEKTYNMLATGKKFKISGIAKKLNSSEGSVRKMISDLNAKGYDIELVAEGTYQMSK